METRNVGFECWARAYGAGSTPPDPLLAQELRDLAVAVAQGAEAVSRLTPRDIRLERRRLAEALDRLAGRVGALSDAHAGLLAQRRRVEELGLSWAGPTLQPPVGLTVAFARWWAGRRRSS